MASINNRVFRTVGSPLILPGHHTCMLKPVKQTDFHITIDHLTLITQGCKIDSISGIRQKDSLCTVSTFSFLEKGA